MLKEFKSGLVGILRGLNPFDMKCDLEYSLERNPKTKEFVNIEERFRNITRYIYYPITSYCLNIFYAILNRKERMNK